MKQLFPSLYRTTKVIFLFALTAYILAFLSLKEGYLPQEALWVYERLHSVVFFVLGIFALLSFFQHFAATTTKPLLLRLSFFLLGFIWCAVVVYVFLLLPHA